MSTQVQTETTGVKGADEFVARARELGLTVKVKSVRSEATYYRDGSVMLPAVLSISVAVTLPVPSELDNTALGMVERCTSLTSYWSKRDAPRARGRWVLANYSTLGWHKDLHVMRRLDAYLNGMATDLQNLRKLVQG